MDFSRIFQMRCGVQHYPWGGCRTSDAQPFIADLLGCAAAAGEPFAELWIGAHPTLPSMVSTPGGEVGLDRLVAGHPREILGDALAGSGVTALPFLLKILDCDQPLSIQAHPDLERARQLHARDPEHYPDANHKPEIAIGITGMEAFCQFRPAADILADLPRLPPLRKFLDGAADGRRPGGRDWLRALYGRIFAADAPAVAEVLRGLAAVLRGSVPKTRADEWFLRLGEFYPGDRGALSAYFLNIVGLGSGEGVFLGPNEPHAYLHGTIIECMANSDNVVRAGLTPKFIDRDVLVDMLTYRQGTPEIDRGREIRPGERVYTVPVPEFQVEIYRHQAGCAGDYAAGGAVSILLVLDGAARLRTPQAEWTAGRGTVWLWPAALPACTIDYLAPGTTIVRARPNMQTLPALPLADGAPS